MSFIAVGVIAGVGAAASAGISAHGANKAKKAAERKERAAREEMERYKDMYSNLDTSNPYANMENTMEDLTINQKQAQMQQQQFQQSQANILSNLKGAAGGGGIAATAQALAQQGQLASQKSAASIGQQEATNQMARQKAAGQIQLKEREGDIKSREMERDKVGTLLGMSQQEMATANAEQAAGTEQMFQGIGEVAQAGADYASGGYGPTPQGRAELSAEDAAWNAANPDKRQRKGQIQYGGGGKMYSEDEVMELLSKK